MEFHGPFPLPLPCCGAAGSVAFPISTPADHPASDGGGVYFRFAWSLGSLSRPRQHKLRRRCCRRRVCHPRHKRLGSQEAHQVSQERPNLALLLQPRFDPTGSSQFEYQGNSGEPGQFRRGRSRMLLQRTHPTADARKQGSRRRPQAMHAGRIPPYAPGPLPADM